MDVVQFLIAPGADKAAYAAASGKVSDAPTGVLPAALHFEKFTSQDQLGHFLLKQYHIRNPYELSSCEVCHR